MSYHSRKLKRDSLTGGNVGRTRKLSAKLHVSYRAIYPHLSKHGRKFRKASPTRSSATRTSGIKFYTYTSKA